MTILIPNAARIKRHGIKHDEQDLIVLSACCGAEFSYFTRSEGGKCSNCSSMHTAKIDPIDGLAWATTVSLSCEEGLLARWIKGWTNLDCEVKVKW